MPYREGLSPEETIKMLPPKDAVRIAREAGMTFTLAAKTGGLGKDASRMGVWILKEADDGKKKKYRFIDLERDLPDDEPLRRIHDLLRELHNQFLDKSIQTVGPHPETSKERFQAKDVLEVEERFFWASIDKALDAFVSENEYDVEVEIARLTEAYEQLLERIRKYDVEDRPDEAKAA